MACRLPSFVSIHAHIITKRTKITKDLKLKKNERNLNYVIWCMYLVREYIWHGHAVKTKTGMKNRNFFKIKVNFPHLALLKQACNLILSF